MSDEHSADILRKWEDAIIVRFRATNFQVAVFPVDVARGKTGHFLHAKSKTQKQKQQGSVAEVSRFFSAACGMKGPNLLLREILWQMSLSVIGDFGYSSFPAF